MYDRKLISIVTPCFNEEGNVEIQHSQILKALEPYFADFDFEFIYTDNCSDDRTFELLNCLAARNPNFRVVRFSTNIGGDRAMLMGLRLSKGDAVVLIQADLQDPPALIPEFISNWVAGYDIVFGQIKDRDESVFLRTARRIYYKIVSTLADSPIHENAGDFRLMSRRSLQALLEHNEHDLYIRGIVARLGFKQKAIPYERAKRHAGKSSVNFMYLISYAINGLLSTSLAPLRAVTYFGLIFSLVGFLFAFYAVISKLCATSATQPKGFVTLASIISFFAGLQILALGIIGEYIRKIYMQTLNRPKGFIQDRVNLLP